MGASESRENFNYIFARNVAKVISELIYAVARLVENDDRPQSKLLMTKITNAYMLGNLTQAWYLQICSELTNE